MEIKRYRKRPVVIEAVRVTWENWKEVMEWSSGFNMEDMSCLFCINTPEGAHQVQHGNYIVCGVAGEFCPVRSDIFDKTYEIAEAETPKEYQSIKYTDLIRREVKLIRDYEKAGSKKEKDAIEKSIDKIQAEITRRRNISRGGQVEAGEEKLIPSLMVYQISDIEKLKAILAEFIRSQAKITGDEVELFVMEEAQKAEGTLKRKKYRLVEILNNAIGKRNEPGSLKPGVYSDWLRRRELKLIKLWECTTDKESQDFIQEEINKVQREIAESVGIPSGPFGIGVGGIVENDKDDK